MAADSLLAKAQALVSKDRARTHLEELFDCLLAENGPALLRLAGSFGNTLADRDDLFQEMALGIWQALPAFRGESSARTYLFRIAHNRGIAYLVSRRTVHTIEDEELRLPDPRPDPERQLAEEELRQNIVDAVRRLPFVYRDVLTLALEGLNYSEISEILGVSEANVGARLNRARKALRALLEKK